MAKRDEKKPAVTGKTNIAKIDLKKTVSGDKAPVKAKKATAGPWRLLIGNYVLEEALSADMGRVRKAGFEPVVKPSAHKKKSMNRLFVSDFNDRASARSTLEKLKRHTSDAFIIEERGRFSVYAGSYLQSGSANSEKERLKAAGYVTIVKHSTIAIPSQNLSVGPFNSKKAADAARGRLKSAGIQATFMQK
ncbi:MAG: SPOR domain-containing protein [Desulfuromonadaceae bacterium]